MSKLRKERVKQRAIVVGAAGILLTIGAAVAVSVAQNWALDACGVLVIAVRDIAEVIGWVGRVRLKPFPGQRTKRCEGGDGRGGAGVTTDR